jgi:branched-chain amino acid transport system substrate-binding protein
MARGSEAVTTAFRSRSRAVGKSHLAILSLAAAFVVGACGTVAPAATGPAAPSAAASGAVGASVKLGVLTPLSKPGDPGSGQLFGRGAELAAQWVGERLQPSAWDAKCPLPGSLDLVTVDDQGTPEKGIAGLRKLALDDKVAGVVGQIHSAVMLALGPIAEELKVPVMAGTASSTDISKANRTFTFQAHAITSDRANAVGTFIEGNADKFKKVAVVAENTDYGTGNVTDLKARLANVAGVTLQDWVFDKETKDLSPLLLQVKAFDPDLVFNVSSGPTEYLMVKQAKDAGLLSTSTMVISDDRPLRQEFWDNVGDAGKSVVFVTYYAPKQKLTEAGEWFKAEYQKKHGEAPVYTAYQGFGNTILMAQAVNRACSTDGAAIARALVAGGLTSWNADGVAFKQDAGVDWQRLHIPVLLLQYTAANQPYADAPIVFPDDLKTAPVLTP